MLNNVYTVEDLVRAKNELKTIRKGFFSKKAEVGQSEFLFVKKSDYTRPEEVDREIEALDNSEEVRVTLGFVPKETFVRGISSELKVKLSTSVALRIKVDPEIIAGAILTYLGKYKDNSVLKTANEI